MTGVGVSWSAPVWVGLSDRDYSELIQRKAVAVTKRDKRRGGQYTVKQAIEAIDEAFHRCSGFDPYDGSKLDPELLGTYSNCLLYTSPSPRDATLSRMPSSA